MFDRCAEFDVQQRLPVLCVIVTRGTQNAAHGEPLKRVALYLHLPGGMRAYPYNIPGVGQKHIYIYIYIYIIFGREFTMQNQQRVLSLIVASSGHHTQFTFQNHHGLGPQMTTSGDIQWNSEEMKAMWDCASQPWVLDRSSVQMAPTVRIVRF